jgi:hypothetical protein
MGPTDIEKKSLEAHVELCAERYKNLDSRINLLTTSIAAGNETIAKIHDMVVNMSEKRSTQLIGWGIGIIGFLSSVIGYLVVHYILK